MTYPPPGLVTIASRVGVEKQLDPARYDQNLIAPNRYRGGLERRTPRTVDQREAIEHFDGRGISLGGQGLRETERSGGEERFAIEERFIAAGKAEGVRKADLLCQIL
jgi:hypothetical protein